MEIESINKNCPNCGAPLSVNTSQFLHHFWCSYCGTGKEQVACKTAHTTASGSYSSFGSNDTHSGYYGVPLGFGRSKQNK